MAITRNDQAEYRHWKNWEIQIIDGRPVRFSDVCVHEFLVADSEDPVLYAADPLNRWQNSDEGQWVMANAVEQPYWTQVIDSSTYCYKFRIMARMSDANQTFWMLKWGGLNK